MEGDPPPGLSPKDLKIWEGAVKLLDKCRREKVEPEKMAPAAISAEVELLEPAEEATAEPVPLAPT